MAAPRRIVLTLLAASCLMTEARAHDPLVLIPAAVAAGPRVPRGVGALADLSLSLLSGDTAGAPGVAQRKLVRYRSEPPLLSLGALQDQPAVEAPASEAPPMDDAALAKKLSNPVASLISVPFQFNFDRNIGPSDDGERFVLNVQPVIPISLNEHWNLISRTIVPIVWQDDIFPGAGDQFGLGDIVQSLFFSPKEPTSGGWIWGVGPVFLLPSATDSLLGSEKFGIGPTVVLLKQDKGWTYGALANHIVSVAGDSERNDVNATFLQPFVSYTTPTAWTFTLNTESTYDWEQNEWSVPINFQISKLFRVGGQPMSIGAGIRYWADSPTGGPEGVGFRVVFTLLFPT